MIRGQRSSGRSTLPVSHGPRPETHKENENSGLRVKKVHSKQRITHLDDKAYGTPYKIDHEGLLLDHHIYSRRVCIGCLKRAAYLHEKWVSLPVAFPMCPFYLLCQILKPEEWVCCNSGWLEHQNLVFLPCQLGLENLGSPVSALRNHREEWASR